MNIDNEKETFCDKHRYFFQNYVFNLEGMPRERKQFEEILQSLGAEISMDAEYTLIDDSYFTRTQEMCRNDFYSINFIVDSLQAKRLMPIDNYRFLKKSEIYCCVNGKFILKTDSCKKYYEAHICCQKCKNRTQELDPMTESNCSSEHTKDFESVKTTDERPVTEKEKNSVKVDQNEETNETSKNASDISDICDISDISDSEEEFNYLRKVKTEKRKQNRPIIVSDSDSDAGAVVGSHKIYKRIKTNSNTSRTVRTIEKAKAVDSESNSESDEICLWREYDESKEWWMDLPAPHIVHKMMDELNMYVCEGKKRGKTFHEVEMKLMISYLIDRNQIKNAKSYEPWKNMIKEGYLNHRTDESLRNNFRKSILKNLKKFNLPREFLTKFSRLVDTATKRKCL